jgi:GIY-YIG catalytic domain
LSCIKYLFCKTALYSIIKQEGIRRVLTEQRLLSHNELGKDWSAKYRPWQLIYSKEFVTKKEAMGYEKWLKTGVGRDFIKGLGR